MKTKISNLPTYYDAIETVKFDEFATRDELWVVHEYIPCTVYDLVCIL